jgi:hypothetical protein
MEFKNPADAEHVFEGMRKAGCRRLSLDDADFRC